MDHISTARPPIRTLPRVDLVYESIMAAVVVAQDQVHARLMDELLDVTGELARARTRHELARVMVERAARPLAATAIGVWSVDERRTFLELLDTTPEERTRAAGYRRIPLIGDTPIAEAVRSGQDVILGSLEEHAARFPASRARLDTLDVSSHAAYAIVPIAAGGASLGAMCFTFGEPRVFEVAERSYMTLVARHCALALERVQLLEQERVARRDVEVLYELIASFNRIDRLDEVYSLALESVKRASRADRAAILLFDDANVMRFRASIGLSEAYRAAVEGHSPWTPDELFPAPVTVDDTAIDPAWAAYRPVFAAEGIRAIAFVPIIHHRKLIGKFMLYRNEPLPFATRDLQVTATVAVHVAQAAERKRQEHLLQSSYRDERDARVRAEEEARAREEILSVVSHDLKNPLGTIIMGASTLLNVDAGDATARVRLTAERIHRQAERMSRLVEDLVDFAGIQAGRLALDRSKHRPHAILAQARDIFGPIASERGLRLETDVAPTLPTVDCDGNRAVQILSSLVANALKVTPKGGAIAIGAAPKGDEIVFFVRDSGPGIAAEELPILFERFWRGKQSAYRGTGLGLSIARGIVDAHGGRIWAESRLGAGSTFYFSLSDGA